MKLEELKAFWLKEFEEACREASHVALIHHWDADGIASCAMLVEEIRKRAKNVGLSCYTPKIGLYRIPEDDLPEIAGDFAVVADISLDEGSVERLRNKLGRVFVVDHHKPKSYANVLYFNPLLVGDDYDAWPSTTWVIKELFNRGVDLLCVLGAVGDCERRLTLNEKIWPLVERFLAKSKVKLEELLRAVELLDSSYKVGNRVWVTEAPMLLVERKKSLKALLEDELLKKQAEAVKSEVERWSKADPVEESDGVAFFVIESKYNVISSVTRKLAWSGKWKVVVVLNQACGEGFKQLYIRTSSKSVNLSEILAEVRKHALEAGGKKEVLGAVLPGDISAEEALSIAKKALKRLMGSRDGGQS